MSGGGYWTNLVTGFDGVRSLDEFSFPMTQKTHTYEDVQVGAGVEEDEVQAVVGVEVVEVCSPVLVVINAHAFQGQTPRGKKISFRTRM